MPHLSPWTCCAWGRAVPCLLCYWSLCKKAERCSFSQPTTQACEGRSRASCFTSIRTMPRGDKRTQQACTISPAGAGDKGPGSHSHLPRDPGPATPLPDNFGGLGWAAAAPGGPTPGTGGPKQECQGAGAAGGVKGSRQEGGGAAGGAAAARCASGAAHGVHAS